MELNNVVIEVLDIEHGKKVIDFFKSKGINTHYLTGACNKKQGYDNRFYGIINGIFNQYNEFQISKNNAKIVTLEELTNTYPKVMWVSDCPNFSTRHKRVVFMEKCGEYLAWASAETKEEAKKEVKTSSWGYAKDIEPDLTLIKEVSIEEIADKFGISVENLRIKKQ